MKSLLITAWLALALSSYSALPQHSARNGTLYITHVTVIDTRAGGERKNQTVVISGTRISDVFNTEALAIPHSAKVIDGTGKYLMPGLWDMHVHGTQYDSTLPLYIANGVTGVREMFGPPDANKFRAELARKGTVAPHIYLGSPILDGNPPFWHNSIPLETPEAARRVVDEQKQRGADFIKIYPGLSRETYFAVLDEAKRRNISVVGHLPHGITAWEASMAGQKSIEHLIGIAFACSTREGELGSKANRSKTMIETDRLEIEASKTFSREKCGRLFQQFIKHSTWQVPTLTVYSTFGMLNDSNFRSDRRMKYYGGEFRGWLDAKDDSRLKSWSDSDFQVERELFRHEKELTGELFRAGVPLLAGTDAGNPYCFPGFSLHDELRFLVESGMTPIAALQAATWNAAVFMGATDRYGSIERRKVADLVLLDADPTRDINNTTKISEVFENGKEFDRAALDDILKAAKAAALPDAK